MSAGSLHLAMGPGTRKARDLARSPSVAVGTRGAGLDVVVEGTVTRVEDADALAAVAERFLDRYGWEVEVREGALHGDGAPTAGPPPYVVLRVVPERAFAFPTAGDLTATRWSFGPSGVVR